MNRIGLAFKAFWKVLTDVRAAERVAPALAAAPPAEGPDLRILAVLQRDGRLVDFLQEEIGDYTDAQVGAAVRKIHADCRKALREYLAIEPLISGEEGSDYTVPSGFDPAEVRLSGNVQGAPPFRGVLKHHGWRAKTAGLPALPSAPGGIAPVLAPAEVEVS